MMSSIVNHPRTFSTSVAVRDSERIAPAACPTSSQPTEGVASTFSTRYEELCSDPTSVLNSDEYRFLRDKLAVYRDLQQQYGAKQSEQERAKRGGTSLRPRNARPPPKRFLHLDDGLLR